MCFRRKKKVVEEKQTKVEAKPATEAKPAPAKKVEPTLKKEVQEKPAPKKVDPVKSSEKEVTEPAKPTSQKYHISQNNDDKSEFYKQWRVRKSGSDKTIKFFKTQKEAIDYAKTLAKNADSDIVIHKTDGKIRKQKY